ncbi:MAG: aminomethyl-transferring glycine dehydrogenase subunit GcvPB, partial [Sodaliphilus sp.]|nr:aminomethyl-transferring glycine dehydrogenase subunit GcvPB [Sodaliphilus sp.]
SLSEIAGMSEFTLNPFAGAHGELTGLMVIRRYHESRGDAKRTKIIVPDSAHGTNPASAAVCGLDVVEVKSKPDGRVDVDDLKPLLDDTIAGMMMTNPNTLGLFENNIAEIAQLVHDCGGLMYYDGANLNPMLGKCRPGDIGFDVMHINLHKTFSTPHGGGGPGSGPIGVREGLEQFLPNPRVTCDFDDDGMVDYKIEMGEQSLGSISGFLGNFGVMMRALTYIVTLGSDNLKWVGPLATLNANYIKESLKDCYELPIEGVCKHEFVFDGLKDKSTGVTTLDVAKRLLDYGYHAPTIYFPLLFHQALMIEPTENESKETLDGFIAVMKKIAQEAKENPDLVKTAPHSTPVQRLDDTKAALKQIVTWDELCATNEL